MLQMVKSAGLLWTKLAICHELPPLLLKQATAVTSHAVCGLFGQRKSLAVTAAAARCQQCRQFVKCSGGGCVRKLLCFEQKEVSLISNKV
jgi:hypothetical protein